MALTGTLVAKVAIFRWTVFLVRRCALGLCPRASSVCAYGTFVDSVFICAPVGVRPCAESVLVLALSLRPVPRLRGSHSVSHSLRFVWSGVGHTKVGILQGPRESQCLGLSSYPHGPRPLPCPHLQSASVAELNPSTLPRPFLPHLPTDDYPGPEGNVHYSCETLMSTTDVSVSSELVPSKLDCPGETAPKKVISNGTPAVGEDRGRARRWALSLWVGGKESGVALVLLLSPKVLVMKVTHFSFVPKRRKTKRGVQDQRSKGVTLLRRGLCCVLHTHAPGAQEGSGDQWSSDSRRRRPPELSICSHKTMYSPTTGFGVGRVPSRHVFGERTCATA